ncbi:hypothetical protein RFI_26604 [Reticulomyxa filosa]|uniref:Kelch motif family protein n=1 Tax=Reticulomyxa filosa TaxID=46433 RepID=X6M9T6_RETFI|nr:hypothetical protein RFI_26604 [Reticulomyxa filosa]|eukprot:ETO10773.1 hypothetical protein RFI_26604 [Reticulomyxa filosa]
MILKKKVTFIIFFFKEIINVKIPTDNSIQFHCFVSNSENEQVQEMMKINQKNKPNYQMLLLCRETGLLIEYDEDNNNFKLPVCDNITSFYQYAYVCINDVILSFGGYNDNVVSKSVHKYSIRESKWMTFQNTLPSLSRFIIAILSEEDNHIYIIGGIDISQ